MTQVRDPGWLHGVTSGGRALDWVNWVTRTRIGDPMTQSMTQFVTQSGDPIPVTFCSHRGGRTVHPNCPGNCPAELSTRPLWRPLAGGWWTVGQFEVRPVRRLRSAGQVVLPSCPRALYVRVRQDKWTSGQVDKSPAVTRAGTARAMLRSCGSARWGRTQRAYLPEWVICKSPSRPAFAAWVGKVCPCSA